MDNYTLKPGPIVDQDTLDMMVNEYEGGCGENHLYKLLCEVAHSHTALSREITRLNRVIAKELSENDELGAEYTYINALKEDYKVIKSALVNWYEWELEQVRKEGPYVGKVITKLIDDARIALMR